MEKKGVIEMLDESTYGEVATGDPFDALEKALPDTKEVPAPQIPEKEETQSEEEAPQNLSVPMVLSRMLKDEGIDIGELDEKATIKDVFKKAKEVAIGDPEKIAEQYAKRKGWTDEMFETSKMLNSGQLKFPEQEQFNKLNAYANFNFKIDENTSKGEQEALINNAKAVIAHMYESTLTGKAQRRAIDNIDEYSEDFEDLVAESVKFAGTQRDAFKRGILDKLNNDDKADISFNDQVKEVIRKGDLFGVKNDDSITKAQLDAIYEDTEKVTYDDGTTDTVSKYVKNLLDIRKDPVKAAKLMVLIAEGMDLRMPMAAGAKAFGNDLEKQLSSAVFNSDKKVLIGKKTPAHNPRIIEELESRTY